MQATGPVNGRCRPGRLREQRFLTGCEVVPMYLESADFGRVHATRDRAADAPAGASRRRVSLMDRWRALLHTLHEIACLQELGGCAEELIDSRTAQKGAAAKRW
jgi:hypothetical protein